MAIYTNEHLTDLLNEQYEKVRELEKKLNEAITFIQEHADTIEYSRDRYIEILRRLKGEAFLATLNEVRE